LRTAARARSYALIHRHPRRRCSGGDGVDYRDTAGHIASPAIDDPVALIDRGDELVRRGHHCSAAKGRQHACGRQTCGGGHRRSGGSRRGHGVVDDDGAVNFEAGTGRKGRWVALGRCGGAGGCRRCRDAHKPHQNEHGKSGCRHNRHDETTAHDCAASRKT
jgi:hypothetical protein